MNFNDMLFSPGNQLNTQEIENFLLQDATLPEKNNSSSFNITTTTTNIQDKGPKKSISSSSSSAATANIRDKRTEQYKLIFNILSDITTNQIGKNSENELLSSALLLLFIIGETVTSEKLKSDVKIFAVKFRKFKNKCSGNNTVDGSKYDSMMNKKNLSDFFSNIVEPPTENEKKALIKEFSNLKKAMAVTAKGTKQKDLDDLVHVFESFLCGSLTSLNAFLIYARESTSVSQQDFFCFMTSDRNEAVKKAVDRINSLLIAFRSKKDQILYYDKYFEVSQQNNIGGNNNQNIIELAHSKDAEIYLYNFRLMVNLFEDLLFLYNEMMLFISDCIEKTTNEDFKNWLLLVQQKTQMMMMSVSENENSSIQADCYYSHTDIQKRVSTYMWDFFSMAKKTIFSSNNGRKNTKNNKRKARSDDFFDDDTANSRQKCKHGNPAEITPNSLNLTDVTNNRSSKKRKSIGVDALYETYGFDKISQLGNEYLAKIGQAVLKKKIFTILKSGGNKNGGVNKIVNYFIDVKDESSRNDVVKRGLSLLRSSSKGNKYREFGNLNIGRQSELEKIFMTTILSSNENKKAVGVNILREFISNRNQWNKYVNLTTGDKKLLISTDYFFTIGNVQFPIFLAFKIADKKIANCNNDLRQVISSAISSGSYPIPYIRKESKESIELIGSSNNNYEFDSIIGRIKTNKVYDILRNAFPPN